MFNRWSFLTAAVITLAIRLTLYTEDCNLLVMGATFAIAYIGVRGIQCLWHRLR